MPAKDLIQQKASSPHKLSEAWIPVILPTLKSRWTDELPKLNDWLSLLHVAASKPQKLPTAIAKFSNGSDPQHLLTSLTALLEITVDAAQPHANQLNPVDWHSLATIHSIVFKAAAQFQSDGNHQSIPQNESLQTTNLQQTMGALNKLMADLTAPTPFLDEAVSLIQQKFGYEYVNLFLLQRNQKTLTLQAATSQPDDAIKLTADRGLIGRAASTGQSVLVNDVSGNADFVALPHLSNIKAQLAVPMIAGKNLFGVLDIESTQPNAFTATESKALQSVANYIAIAIENSHLQNAQKRSTREQALVYENIVQLGTEQDVGSVLSLMSQKIAEALDAGACVICQMDKEFNTLTALAEHVAQSTDNPARGWRKLGQTIALSKDPIAQQLLKANRPIINRATPQQDEKFPWQIPSENTNPELCWHVMLALPLKVGKGFAGLVEIYDKNPHRLFSAEDIQICRILATQTIQAMERARLLDETLTRLSEVSMLYTLAQELSGSLDLQNMLNTVVTSLRQVIGCRACCIFLLDRNGEELEIKAADGLKPQWRQAAKLRLGEGIAGRAAAENKTIYLPDTQNDPEFIFFDEEVRSLMVVPLVAQGEVIGAINVDNDQPNAFGPTQERLLTIAAAQAGITIANARLFAEISNEQQQMQAIIQHMADGLLLVDSHGIIRTCNYMLAHMLGLRHKEIIGQSINASELHPNLAAVTASITHQARTGVLTKEVTIDEPRPRALQVFATTVMDKQHNPIGQVRLVHDVTKERELEQLKADFFSTISHELRTPLFSIQGFAQLMLEEDDLDLETRKEFLETIHRQTTQLGEMVNNLLDLSKFDEGKLLLEQSPISLLDVIKQTVIKLQGFAHQKNVKIVSELPSQLPTINGDKQRLEQVLTNLIGNAIKFSDEDDAVTVMASATDSQILVQVKDNGVGIPAEDLESIFSRFYQANNKSERSAMGSGLGLHIAKKIVEGHKGRIWVESESGQGSTFSFTIPVSTD